MESKRNIRVDASVRYSVPELPNEIQDLGKRLKNFWHEHKKVTFQMELEFSVPSSYSEYCNRLHNLKPIFQQLNSYGVFNLHTHVKFSSLEFDAILADDADFHLFTLDPKRIRNSAYTIIEYKQKYYSYDSEFFPVVACHIRNTERLKAAHDEDRLGASFVTYEYDCLCIPISSILKMDLYKL